MGAAIKELLSLRNLPDPFDWSLEEIFPLQLEAARESFAEKRPQVPVLDRQARERGLAEIRTLRDVAALNLAHTTYKSYPATFLTQGKWRELLHWLSMVSTPDYKDIDLEGVTDIDDFVDRLWAKDYFVTTSSGTGGKMSLISKSRADMDLLKDYIWRFNPLGAAPTPDHSFHYFCFGPTDGTYAAAYASKFQVEGFARPDSTHILIQERMRNSRLMQMAAIRKRMTDGEATPEEIVAFESDAVAQGKRLRKRFEEMADALIELRHEKVWLMAMVAQMWDLMEYAKSRGLTELRFGPGSMLMGGGGRKHLTHLPDDFERQISDFFGRKTQGGYGMSEMSWMNAACAHGSYHAFPWAINMPLDRSGEELLDREGILEGRFAFLDLSMEHRWGGMISGDKVTFDFTGSCPCGRKSPTILPPISRYSDEMDGDKIQCAGTIDAYIRGSFAEA